MVFFAARVKNDEQSRRYVERLKEEFSKPASVLKNPFEGEIRTITSRDELIVIAAFEVLSPPVHLYGLFPFILGWWLSWPWLTFFGGALMATYAYRSGLFYYLVFRWNIKRKGYKHTVERLSPEETLRYVYGAA